MKKLNISKEIKNKKPITFRLNTETIESIRGIAEYNNISMVSVVEYSIKKLKESLESEGYNEKNKKY